VALLPMEDFFPPGETKFFHIIIAPS